MEISSRRKGSMATRFKAEWQIKLSVRDDKIQSKALSTAWLQHSTFLFFTGNKTSASDNTMKLVLSLTIAGGALALFALLFVTTVYRRRRRQEQCRDMGSIGGNSSMNIIKTNLHTETLGRQLQVHTFGRALTPDLPMTPSQQSMIDDPDYHIVLPPLMYSDVLRVSTIGDTISTRPSSTMSAAVSTRRSKSFESTLSSDTMDGVSPSFMQANMLAISLHELDQESRLSTKAGAYQGTSV